MKEDPAKDFKSAVVLEDRYELLDTKVVRTYRVRILSEAGRDAANLFFFLGETPKIEGRTVYPDGKVVPFDGIKDSNTKTLFRAWWVDAKRTLVIPPGINGDCVFEARWEEPRLGTWHARYIQYLGGKFHTLRTVIDIEKNLRRSHEVVFNRDIQSEVTDEGKVKRFTLHDLPAKDEVPYSLRVTQGLPRIVVFDRTTSRSLTRQLTTETDPRRKADLYWSEAAEKAFKPEIELRWRIGSNFEAFKAELLAGLPDSPHARAAMILARMNQRIRNRTYQTFAESAEEKKVHTLVDYRSNFTDYEASAFESHVERGRASAQGIWSMYYYLLREAGLKPLVGMVADRELVLFNYLTPDLNQITHMLIGIDEPAKGTLWVDPSLRFAPPGLIPLSYQGNPGVLVDTANWTARSFQVPVQPPMVNRRRFEYQVSPDEDGESFSMAAEFLGIPEYEERTRFMVHDAGRRDHILKEELERTSKGLALSKSEVLNTEDISKGFEWKVAGHLDIDATGKLEVTPFPAMPMPMWVPEKFSDTRVEPILIPYRRLHGALCHITVPQGYRFVPSTPSAFSNRFGSVSWSAALASKGSGTEVTVTYSVEVSGFYENAEAYGDLKAFLGWISETSRRTVLLEKVR